MKLSYKRELVSNGQLVDFSIGSDGNLDFCNRLFVPKDPQLKQVIFTEAYNSVYSLHPENTKMYCDLKQRYWWLGMKREISKFVSRCLVCQ